jgi:hypothetical protein
MFCVVTNSFPGSSLAAATACCRGGFHVKWDSMYQINAWESITLPVTVAVRSEAWVLTGWLLGSWVRIPLKAWMFVRVFLCWKLSCVGIGLATGWSLVQGVLSYVKNRSRNLLYVRRPGSFKDCRATGGEYITLKITFIISHLHGNTKTAIILQNLESTANLQMESNKRHEYYIHRMSMLKINGNYFYIFVLWPSNTTVHWYELNASVIDPGYSKNV